MMAYNLGLIWSYGLFLYLVTLWLARKLYRRGYNRLASGGTLRKRYGGHWLDDLLCKPLFFLDTQTRMLIIKDFRTFAATRRSGPRSSSSSASAAFTSS